MSFSSFRSSFSSLLFHNISLFCSYFIPAGYGLSAVSREWKSGEGVSNVLVGSVRESLTASGLLPGPFIPGYF